MPSAVTRMRLHWSQKQPVIGRIRPTAPRYPGIPYRRATPACSISSSDGQRSSTSPAGRNRSFGQDALGPMGISSIKRTSMGLSRVSATKSMISSSLTPPISTVLIFTCSNPT